MPAIEVRQRFSIGFVKPGGGAVGGGLLVVGVVAEHGPQHVVVSSACQGEDGLGVAFAPRRVCGRCSAWRLAYAVQREVNPQPLRGSVARTSSMWEWVSMSVARAVSIIFPSCRHA